MDTHTYTHTHTNVYIFNTCTHTGTHMCEKKKNVSGKKKGFCNFKKAPTLYTLVSCSQLMCYDCAV